jgi:hypothetical protein
MRRFFRFSTHHGIWMLQMFDHVTTKLENLRQL